MKIAFIITVYKNDKLEYFKEAIESIVNQDYGFENINIYLGIDGDIPKDIEKYIEENKHLFFKIIKNDENKGLAYTLNRLIDALENEKYIFRMDSDDINKPYRVRKQLEYMEKFEYLEIVGGAIEEIDDKKNKKMIRKFPKTTQEAKKYIVKASIFAHPTVCFKKTFFEKGFKYNEANKFKYNEDLALWYEALINNIEVANIDDVILMFRVSNSFYKRRSYQKAIGEFQIYWKGIIKLYGYNWRLIYPVARLITRLMPSYIVKFLYNSNLRKKLNSN